MGVAFTKLPHYVQQVARERWPDIERMAVDVLRLDWSVQGDEAVVSYHPNELYSWTIEPEPVVPLEREVVRLYPYSVGHRYINFWIGYGPKSRTVVVKNV